MKGTGVKGSSIYTLILQDISLFKKFYYLGLIALSFLCSPIYRISLNLSGIVTGLSYL